MYQALYRKYRPQTFDEVVGQDVIVKILKNAVLNNKLSHAYLFSGPRGTGKTSVAKILAKTINCYNLQGDKPCNECVSCTQINNRQTNDIIEIDAASNNGIDEIRELKSKVNLVPSNSKYKVYIIDEVHMLTVGAFNALLKTLEEPPAHIIFILATTEPHKIPLTILSRCQRFDFKKISERKILEKLQEIVNKEKIEIELEALSEISRLADGGLRDAISILDQVLAYSNDKITLNDVHEVNGTLPQSELFELIEAIIDKNVEKTLKMIDKYNDKGKNLVKLTEEMINFARNVLIKKNVSKKYNDDTFNDEILNTISKKTTNEYLFDFINNLNQALNDMKSYNSSKIVLELLVIKLINNNHINENNVKKEMENNKRVEKDNQILPQENSVKKDKEQEKKNVKEKQTNNNVDNKKIEKKEEIKELEMVKKIRINNTLTAVSKKKLSELKQKISEIQTLILNPKYSAIVSMILDGEPKAAGLDYLVFVYETPRLSEIFNKNILKVEKLLSNFCKINCRVIATDKNDWEIIKKEYKSNTKKYEYIEENFNLKEILNDNKNKENNDIEQLFGQIVQYK